MGQIAKIVLLSLVLLLPMAREAKAELSDLFHVGAAFMTNLAIHESSHFILADHEGAEGNRLQFFAGEGGSFFLGLSTVDRIENRAKLSYNLAGEVGTSYTFEWALSKYRERPTPYNKALLFFSGTDFLWYTLYAFYLAPEKNDMFDPVGIVNDTGMSEETLVAIVAAQFSLNAVRVATGSDRVVPYFTMEPHQAGFGVRVKF